VGHCILSWWASKVTGPHLVLVTSFAVNCLLLGLLGFMTYTRGGIGYLKSRFFSKTLLNLAKGYRVHRQSLFSLFQLATPAAKHPIVFLGDSITEGCDWHEMFGGTGIVINRGISGDTTAGLLERVGSIIAIQPRAVFLMVGANDCIVLKSRPAEAIKDYRAAVERIREESPSTAIYLQSVLPVANSWGQKRNESVVEMNRLIRDLADGETIMFVDLYRDFVVSGSANPRLTSDGLHLNAGGYALWAERIAPYVRTQLAASSE